MVKHNVEYHLSLASAGIAQQVEQLTCNQQVVGSIPITSSNVEDFPSGQRGQTVNLLALLSVVRIHHPPPEKIICGCGGIGRRTRLRI